MLDKVNSIDLAKLQTTTNLFEKMAEFSKSISGDFEGLADTLNDKIAPLIEELKGLLEGVQERVEKSGSDISASVYASKAPILNQSEMANQTAREMPKSTNEEREKETRRRMEAQARQQNSEIVSKLAELIDLFEDGRARVKPVM
jgi:flagellar biosynthesis/type III secretory pathway chaperone